MIAKGSRVKRNPGAYAGALCYPSQWLDEIGVVDAVEHSRLFNVTTARVRWRSGVPSEVELSNLIEIEAAR